MYESLFSPLNISKKIRPLKSKCICFNIGNLLFFLYKWREKKNEVGCGTKLDFIYLKFFFYCYGVFFLFRFVESCFGWALFYFGYFFFWGGGDLFLVNLVSVSFWVFYYGIVLVWLVEMVNEMWMYVIITIKLFM